MCVCECVSVHLYTSEACAPNGSLRFCVALNFNTKGPRVTGSLFPSQISRQANRAEISSCLKGPSRTPNPPLSPITAMRKQALRGSTAWPHSLHLKIIDQQF